MGRPHTSRPGYLGQPRILVFLDEDGLVGKPWRRAAILCPSQKPHQIIRIDVMQATYISPLRGTDCSLRQQPLSRVFWRLSRAGKLWGVTPMASCFFVGLLFAGTVNLQVSRATGYLTGYTTCTSCLQQKDKSFSAWSVQKAATISGPKSELVRLGFSFPAQHRSLPH